MLFDSHAHFNNDSFTKDDWQTMIDATQQAVDEGRMSFCMDIGYDATSSAVAAEHAATYPWCYAAVGCHPHDAKDMTEEKLEQIRQLAALPKVVAIGEIGLDYYYDRSERDVQRMWFRRQIRMANELKMPIAVHSREATQETKDILMEEGVLAKNAKAGSRKGRMDPVMPAC